MVAAYLSICRDSKMTPIYASADMLLQISDKCIRDYLWQMESIFLGSKLSITEFVKKEISIDDQNRGITAASKQKMTLFREKILSAPAEANQFVEGLAKVTSLIQSTGRNYEQIRTPERGYFTYSTAESGNGASFGRHSEMIRDAAQAGFLKISSDDNRQEIEFRVHASLAPNFRFSYRGAYSPASKLSEVDIDLLRTAETEKAMQKAVNSLVNQITGRRDSKRATTEPSMFDVEELE
jgi:hypothetical protein